MKTSKKLIALILVLILQISTPIAVILYNDYNQKAEEAAQKQLVAHIKVTGWTLNDYLYIYTDLDTNSAEYPYIIPETENGFVVCKKSQFEKPRGGVYILTNHDTTFYFPKEELNFKMDPELVKTIGEKGEFVKTPYIIATISYGEITFNKLVYNGNVIAELK